MTISPNFNYVFFFSMGHVRMPKKKEAGILKLYVTGRLRSVTSQDDSGLFTMVCPHTIDECLELFLAHIEQGVERALDECKNAAHPTAVDTTAVDAAPHGSLHYNDAPRHSSQNNARKRPNPVDVNTLKKKAHETHYEATRRYEATLEPLCSGAFGKVFRRHAPIECVEKKVIAKLATNELRALKCIADDEKHAHLVCAVACAVNDEDEVMTHKIGDNIIYLRMELCAGGEMFHYVAKKKQLDISEVWFWTEQLLCGLSHLHRMSIAHLDLKLENVFLDHADKPATLKIGDFGLCSFDENVYTFAGTDRYMPPEVAVLKGRKNKDLYFCGKSADMWSLGVCVFVMALGQHPFDHDNKPWGWMHRFVECGGTQGKGKSVFPDFVDESIMHPWVYRTVTETMAKQPLMNKIIRRCLAYDASVRPTSHELWEQVRDMPASQRK